MNSTLLFVQIIFLVVHSFILAYAGRMQAATLYFGKKLADEYTRSEFPRGLQDAITPKFQNTLNTINIFGWVIIIIFGTYIVWYLGVLSLVAAIVLQSIFQMFLPKNLDHYCLVIQKYMMNKIADYSRDKDVIKKQIAEGLLNELVEIYEIEIKNQNKPVPSFKELRLIK